MFFSTCQYHVMENTFLCFLTGHFKQCMIKATLQIFIVNFYSMETRNCMANYIQPTPYVDTDSLKQNWIFNTM